jgi:6,7-dimethyl-8-ribityllumazine synthase
MLFCTQRPLFARGKVVQLRTDRVQAHAAQLWEGDLIASSDMNFAVIVGQFNALVTDRLKSGALAALEKLGVAEPSIDVVHVPGSFEIPVVAKSMAMSGKYNAIICIGAVVRGATTHYEEVCSAATTGCGHAAVATGAHVTILRHITSILSATNSTTADKTWVSAKPRALGLEE